MLVLYEWGRKLHTQLRLLIGAASEDSNMDVCRTILWHCREADLAEEMVAIGRNSHSDFLEVVGSETGEILVVKVAYCCEVLGFVLFMLRSINLG